MRISTQQAFLNSVSNMQNSQSKLADLQNQLSTGKKLNKPSDDPVAAAQVVKLNRELAQTEKFQDNIGVTQRRLELEETVLDSLNNTIDRMRELTLQAGNTTLTDADRRTIATELRGLTDYAAGLMNTQDSQGEYLFAGSKGFTQPYVKDALGQYDYTGDDGQRMIQVAPDLFVPSSDSGQYLFEAASESIQVTQLPATVTNVTDFTVVDEDAFQAFAAGKGDLTLQIQLNPDNASQTYQYQLLDSSGDPVPLDDSGSLSAELPDIATGDKVLVHGLEFTVTEPSASQLVVEFEQDGIRDLSVAEPSSANAFFQQYGEVELTFDGAGNFTLADTNGDPVTLSDQTYTNGQDLIVGGFRLDVDSPENGDSVTLGIPLSSFTPVTSVAVSSLTNLYDVSPTGGPVEITASAAPGVYDFQANGAETFDLTIDGETFTLTIDEPVNDLATAQAELTDALNDAGVTGVVVGDNGTELTLASTTAQAGSEISVSNFGPNIGSTFNFTDGQRDYYETAASDAQANGGELKVTYDQATDAYYVEAPGYSVDGTPVSNIGITLSWDAANPPPDGDSIYLKLPPHSESALKVETVKQNMLDIALEVATVLETPVETAEQRTALSDQIEKTLDKLVAVSERNIEARTTIGSRINSLENTLTINEDFKLFTQSALSSLEDVDFAEAVSELQLEEAILQAAQASFVRVSELSLFNFIR